ncbi:hypothetical protein I6J48_03715 [Acinetobacter calcoaceticus]|nr:hypothetical protein I6J48_03715 [Acinetobacter calcoaceticus]
MSSNLTASAKFENPLLIAGAFFIYAFTPQNTPHQNLGAFIYPNQSALAKFTAYDHSIYSGLGGKVTIISLGMIRDEVK